jgi:hypothetical protein
MESLLRWIFKAASIFVCVIPKRYRQWWPIRANSDLRGAAIVSGTLEAMIGAPGTALYVAVGLNSARGGMGITGLILNPFLIFPFMLGEGIVRMLAAVGSEQILPTLPLQIVAWIHGGADGRAEQRKQGEPIIDVVEPADRSAYDLRVSSCRPKPHWNAYMTVRFEGEFYQVVREERGAAPMEFVYLLKKNPEWRLVVMVYEYRRDDVLHPHVPPRRWKPRLG